MCIVHLGARAVSGVLKPLRLAGAADMTSSHNGGFILPTVKGLQRVKVRLRDLVSYDDPRCQPPPARSSPTCSAVNPLCNARTVGGIRCSWISFYFFLSFRMFSHTHTHTRHCTVYFTASLSLPPSLSNTCSHNAYTNTALPPPYTPPYSSPYPRDI